MSGGQNLVPGPALSLTSAVSVVVSSMIGAALYTTSGYALADLGSPLLVLAAWAVGGLLALCGALSYGGLAQRFRQSGGEYLFLSRALHPAAGVVAGVVSLLAGFTSAMAFAAVTFEAYLVSHFVPPDAGGRPFPGAVAVALIVVAWLMHGFRLRLGAGLQDLLVVTKLLMLVLFAGFALLVSTQPWMGLRTAPPLAGAGPQAAGASAIISQFAVSLMWISLAYSGFNAAIYITSQTRGSGTTVRRSLVIGTLVVIVIYLLLNAIFVLVPPYDVVVGREDIATAAAGYIGGPVLAMVLRVTILVSLATSVLALMMTGPRVYAKMADDGVLPPLFRQHGDVPRWGVLVQAVLAILVVTLTTLNQLLTYLGLTLSLSAALTVTTLFLLRRRGQLLVVPGYPWPPLVFVVGTLLVAAVAGFQRPVELAVAAATLLVGLLIYAVQHRGGG